MSDKSTLFAERNGGPANFPPVPGDVLAEGWRDACRQAAKPATIKTAIVDNIAVEANGVRNFSTGATRSSASGRYDPEGFMSPIVIERFCEYMNKNRLQPDGSIRDSDNWQKGIPLATYMKGLWRHVLHLWTRHRGYQVQDKMASADVEEDLCAIIFNANGMLFELLKDKRK